MNPSKPDNLDELVSRAIGRAQQDFDFNKWKLDHQKEVIQFQSQTRQPNRTTPAGPDVCRKMHRSKVARIAVAAVIVVAAGLWAYMQFSTESTDLAKPAETSMSPAKMMTAMSLRIAYRRGGIEAVYAQCDKAFDTTQPHNVSIREILDELALNGEQPERTQL